MSLPPPPLFSEVPLAGKYDGIEARIKIIQQSWKSDSLRCSGEFFYLTFRDSVPTTEDFVNYIYWRIVAFCIPRKEREECKRKYTETGDEKYILQITDKAKNLFVRALKARGKTGEPAELILFILLEAFLKAPQVACKMYLKTNKNVPVHGSDGIHLSFDKEAGRLILFWGESKLYKSPSDALDEILSSIKGFITPTNGSAPRERDIDILVDHSNIDNEEQRKAILEFFDPYSKSSNLRLEVFACLAVFDYSFLSECQKMAHDEVEAKFLQEYKIRISTACKLFEKKIKESSLTDLNFKLLLLPLASVEELREKFLNKLGVDRV